MIDSDLMWILNDEKLLIFINPYLSKESRKNIMDEIIIWGKLCVLINKL